MHNDIRRAYAVDYAGINAEARTSDYRGHGEALAARLAGDWLSAYEGNTNRRTDVYEMHLATFYYLYDDYATLEATGVVPMDPTQEARLVVAFGFSDPQPRARRHDDGRLRGMFGPTNSVLGRHWDKGHFIGHALGGAVDRFEINVFVQRRDLNRGHSAEGKVFRSMEKYCAENAGIFCFHRPLYGDGMAQPAALEFGVLKTDGELWVETFNNAPEPEWPPFLSLAEDQGQQS